ncbi:MAG: hypothetical protein LBC61_00930 [Candidatus Peribacteria bacterium]|jgi:hypothetical protein|nr:hypothetical protein [Candidatus Peribacteria bacterium]
MKVYYILSALSIEEKTFFLDSIKNLKQPTDIDELVKTRYYRVNKKTENTTDNTIILETWMFIKSIWLNYGVSPDKINWVHNQNMAILNDDLWIYDNTKYSWDKISVEENIYFFTSRY